MVLPLVVPDVDTPLLLGDALLSVEDVPVVELLVDDDDADEAVSAVDAVVAADMDELPAVTELVAVLDIMAVCWTMIWTYVWPEAADPEVEPALVLAVELALSALVVLPWPAEVG